MRHTRWSRFGFWLSSKNVWTFWPPRGETWFREQSSSAQLRLQSQHILKISFTVKTEKPSLPETCLIKLNVSTAPIIVLAVLEWSKSVLHVWSSVHSSDLRWTPRTPNWICLIIYVLFGWGFYPRNISGTCMNVSGASRSQKCHICVTVNPNLLFESQSAE